MTWIRTLGYAESEGPLRRIYDRIKGPAGEIDNIMAAHSLRPHTMEGHMALYKSVLHHSRNEVPKWFLEALGVWVSLLNRCAYCVGHHSAGMRRLVGDEARTNAILAALEAGDPAAGPFSAAERAALDYAEALTRTPPAAEARHLDAMRAAGLDDGAILEINQVVSYFAYANRTVIGLGCSTEGEVLGHAPSNSDDPADWTHRPAG